MPKISQVKRKLRRRASDHGRFTLWHNGHQATLLGRFTLWHNGRRHLNSLFQAPRWSGPLNWESAKTKIKRKETGASRGGLFACPLLSRLPHYLRAWNRLSATQLSRFTLWHNGRRAKQPGFIGACTRSHTHFPNTVTNHAEKYEGLIQSKILLRLLMYSTANDPQPQMIPRLQMISKMDRKWSSTASDP